MSCRRLGEQGKGTWQTFTDLAPKFLGLDLAFREDLLGSQQDALQLLAVSAKGGVGCSQTSINLFDFRDGEAMLGPCSCVQLGELLGRVANRHQEILAG